MTLPARAVVSFDLDGTLLDSSADLAVALNHGLVVSGLQALPEAQVRAFIGDGARVLVERAVAAATSRPADAATVDAVLPAFRLAYAGALDVHTRPYPGVVDAVAALDRAAFSLVVATNKPGAFARTLAERFFPGVFDVVMGPDDAGAHKPDPRFLSAVAARAGALLVHTGDSPVDKDAAAAAGCPFVGVAWGLHEVQALRPAAAILAHPSELKGVLEALRRARA